MQIFSFSQMKRYLFFLFLFGKFVFFLSEDFASEKLKKSRSEIFPINSVITNIETPFAFLMYHINLMNELSSSLRKKKIAYLSIEDSNQQKADVLHVVQSFILFKKYHLSWIIDLSQDLEQQFQNLYQKIQYRSNQVLLEKQDLPNILKSFYKLGFNGILIFDGINEDNFTQFEEIKNALLGTKLDLVYLVEQNNFQDIKKLPNMISYKVNYLAGHDIRSIIKNFLITSKQYFGDYIYEQFAYEPYIATIAAQILNRSHNMNLEQYISLSNFAISNSEKIQNIINHSTRHFRRSSVDLLQKLALSNVLDFSFEYARILLGKNPVLELLDLTQMNLIHCKFYDKENSLYRIEPVVSKYVLLDKRVNYSVTYNKNLKMIVNYYNSLCNDFYKEMKNFINSPSLETLFLNTIVEQNFNKGFFNEIYRIIIASSLLNLYIETNDFIMADYIADLLNNIPIRNLNYYKILPINLLKDCYLNYIYSLGKYYLKVKEDYVLSKSFLEKASQFVQNLPDQHFYERKILIQCLLLQNQILLDEKGMDNDLFIDKNLISSIENTRDLGWFSQCEMIYTRSLYYYYLKNKVAFVNTAKELSDILYKKKCLKKSLLNVNLIKLYEQN